MNNALSIMTRLQAENLLAGSHILQQIETLRAALAYQSDSKFVSFDEHFLSLQREIDGIAGIKLLESVPATLGTHYQNELLNTLSNVLEEIEKAVGRAVRFQGTLTSAKTDVAELAATFEAWYAIAAAELLSQTDIKLSATNIKALAASEFNRLIGRSNLAIDALIEAVKVELKRLDLKKKMADKQYQMGREQVNAALFPLPESMGHLASGPVFNLRREVEEEELEDTPAHVPYIPHAQAEVKGTFFKTGTAQEVKIVADNVVLPIEEPEVTHVEAVEDYLPTAEPAETEVVVAASNPPIDPETGEPGFIPRTTVGPVLVDDLDDAPAPQPQAAVTPTPRVATPRRHLEVDTPPAPATTRKAPVFSIDDEL